MDKSPWISKSIQLISFSIKEFIQGDWQVVVNRVYHKTNIAADFFVNHALTLPIGVHVFNSAAINFDFLLQFNGFETALPRFVRLQILLNSSSLKNFIKIINLEIFVTGNTSLA